VANFLTAAGKWLGPLNTAEIIYGIPKNLLVAIAYQESHFRESIISGAVKSSAGAVGIMQLLPRYFPGAGVNPLTDIKTAAIFIAGLYKTFKDWQVSVAAYNWGEGDIEHSYAKNADHYYLSQMPAETQNYVRDIFAEVPLPGILLAQPNIQAHNQSPTIEVSQVNTTTVGALPWYKSPVQITQVAAFLSAVIALYPKLGTLLGITTPADVTTFVQTAFGGIALFAPLVGAILRARSTIQPLTLSKSGAENHPATAMAAAQNAEVQALQTPTIPLPPVAPPPAPAAPTVNPNKAWGK
jgi:hypothetical protein